MAARLSRLIPVALALAALAAAADSGWGQTVTAEQIRQAGVFRLGEVLRLADGWDIMTVDEYTWRAVPAGLVPFEREAWAVLVDGLPVNPELLGVTALERLPLDLDAIDSLEFVHMPRLASGIFADRGLVRIHTRRPAQGARFRGGFSTGQETGDPGPFEFVPPARENRDRFGHEATLGASYGGSGGRWWVAGGLGLGLHIAADPAIRQRVLTSGSDLRIERFAPSLRLGFDRGSGRHTLLLGRSDVDDAFRLEAFGVELPVESVLDYAGARGTIPLEGAELEYRLTAEHAEIGPPLEFERTSLGAEVEASFGSSADPDYVGLGVSRRDRSTLRAFGSFGWPLGSAVRQRGSLVLEGGAGRLGAGAMLEQEWRASPRDAVSLVLAAGRPRRDDDDDAPYDWLAAAGVPVTAEGPDEEARSLAVHAGWERVFRQGLTLQLTGFYRAFTADRLERRELSFDSLRLAWRGPVTLVSGARGEAAGVEILGTAALSRSFSIRGRHRMRWRIAGAAAVREAWDRLPGHASQAHLTYAPVPGFSIWGGVTSRGRTRWPEYPDSEGIIPGAIALDFSIHKRVWDGRFEASLALRNLLNSRLRFHPEGGTAWRAAIITLRTALPGGDMP